MTAAKELKSFAKTVFVDTSEVQQLPDEVIKSYRSGGGSLPVVILADPGLSKIYGTYGHSALKGQDYRAIFRDARKEIASDKKDGTFGAQLAKKEEAKPVANKEEKSSGAKIVASRSDAYLYTIDEPVEETWYSSKGTRMRASLVAIEDGRVFHFKNTSGKIIKVRASQLDADSAARAKAATN